MYMYTQLDMCSVRLSDLIEWLSGGVGGAGGDGAVDEQSDGS